MSGNLSLDLIALEANRNIPARNYWRDRLAGLEWERYFDRIPGTGVAGDDNYSVYTAKGPAPVLEQLNALAATDKARHIVLMTALGVLTRQCSSTADICIFTPLYGQPPSPVLNTVIPVRINNFIGKSFSGLLMSVKGDLMLDFKYANYPVEKILGTKAGELKDLPVIGMMLEEIQLISAFDRLSPAMIFSFSVQSSVTLHVRYRPAIFDEECIVQLVRLYFDLLDKLIGNKGEKIEDIETVPQRDKNIILNEFNDTAAFYPKQDTIISLFERQAEKTPDNIAVICDTKRLSYKELRERSVRVASWLQEEKGIKAGDNCRRYSFCRCSRTCGAINKNFTRTTTAHLILRWAVLL